MKWVTENGREMAVADMSTQHIENALAMLKRKGFIGPSTICAYLFGEGPRGQGAQDCFDLELKGLAGRPISGFVDIFEKELEHRVGNMQEG